MAARSGSKDGDSGLRAGAQKLAGVQDGAGVREGAGVQEDVAGVRARLRGVITDWGGVMTNPILHTVNAWLDTEQIDRDSYTAVMRPWITQAYDTKGAHSPIHALERGECSNEDFERLLARQLLHINGLPVQPDGLLARMFAASVLDQGMLELMRSLRRAGLRTALLSNSWGNGDYPREMFPEMFDAVVISAEVGMRKPEERIFKLAAQLLDLQPAQCVFVDDIEANVLAAQAAGLVGVHHREAGATVQRLSELLGLPLR